MPIANVKLKWHPINSKKEKNKTDKKKKVKKKGIFMEVCEMQIDPS